MAKAKKTKSKAKSAKKPAVKKKVVATKSAKKKPAVKPAAKKSAKKPAAKKTAIKKTSAKKAAVKKKASPKTSVKVQKKTPPSAQRSSKSSKSSFDKLIHPLRDRLVVRLEGPSERTAGGLYIPSTVEDRPNQGEVLACGPGAKSKKGILKPLDVKVGDRVLFGAYAGVTAQVDNQEVLILHEEDVLGVLS